MTHEGEIRLGYGNEVCFVAHYESKTDRKLIVDKWKKVVGQLFIKCWLEVYPVPGNKEMERIMFKDNGVQITL